MGTETKRWQYDDKKSRHENMWDALLVACRHFNRNRLATFSRFPGMEPDDVTDEMLAYAFPRLKAKLDNGWEKDHPGLTWVNCAFSVIYDAYSVMCKEYKEAVEKQARTCRTADLDGKQVPIVDLLADGKKAMYRTSRDTREHLADDFYAYVEACEENGMQPDPDVLEDLLFDMPKSPSLNELPAYPDLVMLRQAAADRSNKTGETLQKAREYVKKKLQQGYRIERFPCGKGFGYVK